MFNYQSEICSKVINTWQGWNVTSDKVAQGLNSIKGHAHTSGRALYNHIPVHIRESKFLNDLWNEWNSFYQEAYSWIYPTFLELSNTTLHYTSGVSFGVLASVLILFFIVSRFLPSRFKSIGYILMLLGSSVSLWLLRSFSSYLREPVADILIENWQYLAGYLAISGLISFAIVYRYGPVTEERTLNLIQWFLQGVGLVIVYNSTQIREVSIALVLGLFVIYHFPTSFIWNQKSLNLWQRFFPPKIKLLTEDEYVRQGEVETMKELEKLRQYCQSPECKTWKVISKLKSPHRFAEFIEGNSWHITDEEMLDYDSGPDPVPPHLMTDDDNSEDEMDFVLGSQ